VIKGYINPRYFTLRYLLCQCHCCVIAVQQERGPRKNKGRRRQRVTSRRHDVITGNPPVESTSRQQQQQPVSRATITQTHSSGGTALRRRAGAGAAAVSPGETDWHRSAFTAVRRTARNACTGLVVSNSHNNDVSSMHSASALDVFSQCKYCFVSVLRKQSLIFAD